MSDSLRPHRLQPARLFCPWDFPGNSTGVDCHFLLQGIFPTQGLNLGLPHCRQRLYCLSHQTDPLLGLISWSPGWLLAGFRHPNLGPQQLLLLNKLSLNRWTKTVTLLELAVSWTMSLGMAQPGKSFASCGNNWCCWMVVRWCLV